MRIAILVVTATTATSLPDSTRVPRSYLFGLAPHITSQCNGVLAHSSPSPFTSSARDGSPLRLRATDDVLPPPPSQQFACSPLRLIQLNAETPRRLPWPSRSFIPPRFSFSETTAGRLRPHHPTDLSPKKPKQPTFQLLQDVLHHRLDADHVLSHSPHTAHERAPLPSVPRATSTPRRLTAYPSTYSRSTSTPLRPGGPRRPSDPPGRVSYLTVIPEFRSSGGFP